MTKMKKIILFAVSLFFLQYTVAQNDTSMQFSLLWEMPATGTIISLDPLGYSYVSNGTTLTKYDRQGMTAYTYSDLQYGNFNSIDSRNPMKILVFSKDFTRITLLNMQLSGINSAYNNLINSNIVLPLCVCTAYDNGLWIYDENTDKIMRYDNMNKLCNETMILNHITNEKYIPQQIQESDHGLLIASDSTYGFLIFTHLGTFIKSIPQTGVTDFCIYNNKLVYIQDNMLQITDIQTLWTQSVTLPCSDIVKVRIQTNRMLCVHKNDTISMYAWE